VVNGYKRELVSPPVQKLPPLASQTGKTSLVEEEIQKLLGKGAIKWFTIAQTNFSAAYSWYQEIKDGSSRPIVNLRPLNQFGHPDQYST